MVRPLRLLAAAGCLFLTLAILHTWPLGRAPWRLSLNDNSDAQLNEWIVSWIAHTLPTHPTRLFDGNIFAPEPRTLTYSEPLVIPALVGAPARWLGGSPVLAFNLSLLAGLTLTALAGGVVATRWTGSIAGGSLAGALAAFNVHLLTRLPHLQAAHAWGLPLAWYFADRLADRPTARDAGCLAVVVALTAATSLYWLVFVSLLVAIVGLASARVRSVAAIAAGSVLGVLLALPVLFPYLRFAAEGAFRPLEMVAQFSATPAGYLVSSSRLHAAWSAPLRTTDVNVFFPGVGALILASLGVAAAIRRGGRHRRRAITLVLLAAVGIWLSFGPTSALYDWLYGWFQPLRGLRAAARFGYLFLLAISLAAAYGWAWLERHIRSRRLASLLAACALLLVTAEAWQGPVRTTRFTGVPRIYTLLADLPSPVLLAEVPFYLPAEAYQNGEYVLNSTAHWRPLMNGYSGYTPMSYRRRAESLWLFPAPFAMQTLRREGATHVMVHLERFGADAPDIAKALEGRADLRLLAADRDGRRLYELVR